MKFKLIVWGLFLSFIRPVGAQVKITQFEGIDASNDPVAGYTVDPNGAVGTKQYLEWVDQAYQGFDKVTGAAATPVMRGITPWLQNNMPDCTTGGGNGVILFDHLASRWIIAVRQGGPNYFFCVAVSNTDDLTASNFAWFTYELPLNSLLNINGVPYYPDYPKIATWPDAYYITIDLENPSKGFQENAILVCALDRTNLLAGNTERAAQCFSYPKTPNGLFLGHSLLPADIDGTTPPTAGTPEEFVSIQNPSGSATTSTSLNLWQFHVDWDNPTNSTFTGPTALAVPSFQPGCYTVNNPTDTYCVPEPSTAQTKVRIDSVGDRLMHRFDFRQFPTYQSFLVTHTIQPAATRLQTGIRWYELRPSAGVFNIANTGTLSPDTLYFRFMPSVAQDKVGNLAVGYSGASSALSPSIAATYLNLPGTRIPHEMVILKGTADQENSSHWGGYTSMTVDPIDDCTFWYVNEYLTANQTGTNRLWQTRLAHFSIPSCK